MKDSRSNKKSKPKVEIHDLLKKHYTSSGGDTIPEHSQVEHWVIPAPDENFISVFMR